MADDYEYKDEIAELVGDPTPAQPPSPFDNLQALLDAPPDLRLWGLRKIIAADPAGAVQALFPEYTPKERLHFAEEYRREQRRRRARRLLDEEEKQRNNPLPDRPDVVSLTDFLAEPDEPVRYRVDGLWPVGGRIVLAARNKSGKTTMIGNLVRSLVDGDKFLDHFPVEGVQRVVLLDNEMSPNQIRRWLREQGILNTDAVDLVSLRGRLSTFDILDAATRNEWADYIGSADVLIFDCLRPALDALGLSEDKESGRFLEALDELCLAADVGELLLVHHMGHSNERSRGDSRLEDWPDAKWKIVKEDPEEPTSDAYFAAFGRDVDQPESRLGYDPETRHMSILGGSRRQATTDRVLSAVEAYVADNPGCSGSAIERDVEGNTNAIRAAVKSLVAGGWLRADPQGPGRATLHYPSTPAARDFAGNEMPDVSQS